MDTRDVIARFEAERQALAMMDHPHIARVLDAGATETGRPYFVMELVRGEPITAYCDAKRLSLQQRLALFEQVCQAVQHAHSKGVIHRDLKPSNVLVSTHDDAPFARVIDFGIAKAVAGRLTERTYFTAEQQLIGTPRYMSPEQAEGSADIDTRSDIYALGVVLYELLTGITPVDALSAHAAALAEIQRIIREMDPPLPSAHVVSGQMTPDALVERFRTEPRTLARQLRGELDWIVMKALEKERTRRYETANSLALDIRRYLQGDPVLAAPPSVRYRLGKFVMRHRPAVASAMVLVLVLIGASVFSAVQADRARAAERLADHERDIAKEAAAQGEAVLAFLRDKVLGAAGPEGQGNGLGRDVTLRAAIDAAEVAIASDFADRPAVESALRQTLGSTYTDLGDYAAAIRQLERARQLRVAAEGERSEGALDVLDRLTWAMLRNGDVAGAVAMLEGAVAPNAEGQPIRAIDLRIQAALASALGEADRYEDAIAQLQSLLPRQRALLGSEHPDVLMTQNNLGGLLAESGRVAEGLPYLEAQLATIRRQKGADHSDTILAEGNLGTLYRLADRPVEAERLLRGARDRARKVFGPEHDLSENMGFNLAVTLRALGRDEELPDLLQPLIEARSRRGVGVWQLQMQLAVAWINLGQAERARPLLTALEARFLDSAGKNSNGANQLMRLARHRLRLGDDDIAARIARTAGELARSKTPPDTLLEASSGSVEAVARWHGGGDRGAALKGLDAAVTVMQEQAAEDLDTMWTQAQRAFADADCGRMGDQLPTILERLRALPITQDAGRRTLRSLAADAAAAFAACGDSARSAQFAAMARDPPKL